MINKEIEHLNKRSPCDYCGSTFCTYSPRNTLPKDFEQIKKPLKNSMTSQQTLLFQITRNLMIIIDNEEITSKRKEALNKLKQAANDLTDELP